MKVLSKMQWVSFGALAISAGFVAHAQASGDDTPIGMWLYCLAPYALAAWFVMSPWGEERAQRVSGCWISFAYLVLTYLAWDGAVFRPTSSTAGLIWLFLPIYLVVGAGLAWPVLYVVLKARRRSQ